MDNHHPLTLGETPPPHPPGRQAPRLLGGAHHGPGRTDFGAAGVIQDAAQVTQVAGLPTETILGHSQHPVVLPRLAEHHGS